MPPYCPIILTHTGKLVRIDIHGTFLYLFRTKISRVCLKSIFHFDKYLSSMDSFAETFFDIKTLREINSRMFGW